MYDSQYATAWINSQTSGKDIFRRDFLEPYLKNKVQNIAENSSVLDVGCGWGLLLDFLPSSTQYVGIDPVKDFLDYSMQRNSARGKIKLLGGKLPDIPDANLKYDLVVCSMALHCTPFLSRSVLSLASNVKRGGHLVLTDFCDNAETPLRDSFTNIFSSTRSHIRGMTLLPSGVTVDAEAHFHKESSFEKELFNYGSFSKDYLGPLFVGYDLIKK
jgi:SAM-dependent methyltransferase